MSGMKRRTTIQIEFGKALRKHRHAKGLTQEALAELSGLHFTYVGSVERGERNISIMSIDTLIRALRVTYREFFQDF
jgi:transcriptional regulator with XRE-family HTH domain